MEGGRWIYVISEDSHKVVKHWYRIEAFSLVVCRHRTPSGKTLLEAMHEDLSDVQDVVNGDYARAVC